MGRVSEHTVSPVLSLSSPPLSFLAFLSHGHPGAEGLSTSLCHAAGQREGSLQGLWAR